MKRIVALLVMGIMAISLVGCGGSDDVQIDTSNREETVVLDEPVVAYEDDNFSITVKGFFEEETMLDGKNAALHKYIELEIANKTDAPIEIIETWAELEGKHLGMTIIGSDNVISEGETRYATIAVYEGTEAEAAVIESFDDLYDAKFHFSMWPHVQDEVKQVEFVVRELI